jgi:hypothetical protein
MSVRFAKGAGELAAVVREGADNQAADTQPVVEGAGVPYTINGRKFWMAAS